jgi:hypothetical protein
MFCGFYLSYGQRRSSGQGLASAHGFGKGEHKNGRRPGPEQKQAAGAQGKVRRGDVVQQEYVAALNQPPLVHPDGIKVDL